MRSLFFGSLALGLMGALTVGCGDSGTTSSSSGGGSAGGGGTGGNTTNTGGNGTGGTTTNAGGGGTGGESGCTTITLDEFHAIAPGGYYALLTTQLGGANTDDLGIEFYTPDTMTWSGAIDLGTVENSNYATCTTCIRVFEDEPGSDTDPAPTIYFQTAGTLDLGTATLTDADEDPVYITDGNITNVHLVEVTIDDTTAESTPVPGGKCLDIVSADIAMTPPPVEWVCDGTYYFDGGICDCGCGALDPDCADATKASCDYCDDTGSCDEGVECTDAASTINATDNSTCNAG